MIKRTNKSLTISLRGAGFSVHIRRPKKLPKFSLVYFIVLVSVLSISASYLTFNAGLTIAYNDARAHMNMARLVIDNLNPGLAQLGSVWLPFTHVLTLTLVWNDWLWHSGLGGAVFSMAAYVISVVFVYKFFALSIKDRISRVLGTLLYATNLNILFMQSTPMTELVLILFFILATYFLYKWVKQRNLIDLMGSAAAVFFASITRYDGWFLLIVLLGVVPVVEMMRLVGGTKSIKTLIKKAAVVFQQVEGEFILFATLACFGVFLWLLWNLLIFNNPFYFAYGPFSAHAQQARIESAGALFTKHDLVLSLLSYWWATIHNSGLFLTLYSFVGFIVFAISRKLNAKTLVIYTLLVPLVFHVFSLYLGHSILVVPEMGVNVTSRITSSWFNVRYGLMMVPAVAFFSAYLSSKDKLLKILLVALLIIQPLIFMKPDGIATIVDGVKGTSSLNVSGVSRWIADNVDDDDLILASMSFNSALAFESGKHLKQFIHEGTGHYWATSLVDPRVYAKWVVIANGDVGDPVYESLVKTGNSYFANGYELKERFEYLSIYERRDIPDHFVYSEGSELKVDGQVYRFLGVNSYDLMYRSTQDINQTLATASQAGVTVVRFWGFGEGFSTGIQPGPGIINEERLKVLDQIIASASQHNMRVIITLSNYWGDYGGIGKYLEWVDLPTNTPEDLDAFYTSGEAISRYQYFTGVILGRKNSINGIAYRDDPAIFAWELINEPRSASIQASKELIGWTDQMIKYIHTIDKSHLILSGHEGFVKGSENTLDHNGPWMSDMADLSSNRILTSHYYLHNIRTSSDVSSSFRHPVVSEWKAYSDSADKPLIVEEVGFSKNPQENFGVDRKVLYKNLFEEAVGHGVQGLMLWNWAVNIDSNFGISPLDPRDRGLIEMMKAYSTQISKDL